MMEIKFRAWDIINKIMEYNPIFIYDNGIAYTAHESNEGEYSSIRYADSYIWLEYTCLKDKNGKEIYEGDIVSISCDNGAWLETGVVYFCLKQLRYKVNDYGFTCDNQIEVIGNIYENPELLGGKEEG